MKSVGASLNRVDGISKVTGKAIFAGDLSFPNMLHAKVVRSPATHGKINGINTMDILKLEGVVCVLTANDIPGKNVIPLIIQDQPLLASEVFKFYGEPIALIAAKTPYVAEKALRLAKIDYDPLTFLLDPLVSKNHKDIHLYGSDNIFAHHKIRKGNVDSGFRKADLIIENEYRTPYQEHAYIETQGMVAVPVDDNKIDVYGSMQCPFYVQKAVAEILGYPLSRVRVIQTVTGGAFGGKEDVPSIVAGQASLLAIKTGRPVKLIYEREEDIIAMSKRHPGVIRMKTGVKKDGTLVACEVEYITDGGAYATLSSIVLLRGTIHAIGPYQCPNVKVDAYAVATNKVPCGAYRGFGSPQVLFAAEAQMDYIADKLTISPLEIRKKNILKVDSETATGQILKESVGLEETLDKSVISSNWHDKYNNYPTYKGRKRKGIGMSTVYYGVGLGAGGKFLAKAGSYVQLLKDGTVQVAVGTTEMGQGMCTVLCQIASEELQVPFESVTMCPIDTSRVPDSGPTVASRATVMSGNAVKDACKNIRHSLFGAIVKNKNINADVLYLKDGFVLSKDDNSFRVPMDEAINIAFAERHFLSSHGFAVSPQTSFDLETGLGDSYIVYAYATNIAEVEVDLDTYQTKVIRITAAHDVGKAVNPILVEGQIQGGTLQGLGYAISEEILHDENGKLINSNLSTYVIPTSLDTPDIVPIIVEHPFSKGPYGAKGFGEQPLMGVAPAITNAVKHAIGIDVFEFPITPERLYSLVNNKLDSK